MIIFEYRLSFSTPFSVYPVIVHAVWSDSGFLSHNLENPLFGSGMIDFAGSGVVHVTGGFSALLATKVLGARKGRFHDPRGELLEEPKTFPGHSKALQVRCVFNCKQRSVIYFHE